MNQYELLNEARKHIINPQMFAMELDKSINVIKEKYKVHTTFIIGSFYIYGDVLEKIKNRYK